jgi:FPC/CPF motif-containing protein YcgG
MEGDRGVITKKDSSAEPSLLDDGPLPLIPARDRKLLWTVTELRAQCPRHGGLPEWTHDAFRGFAQVMEDEAFPCMFARSAYRRDTLLLLFAESPTDPASLGSVRDGLNEYLSVLRECRSVDAELTVLNVLFKPEFPVPSLAVHHLQAWGVLQHLHDHDPSTWPENVPIEPDDPLWSFSFAGVPLFINVSSPAHRERRSRNLGPSLTLVIQPREGFDGVGGPHTKGDHIRTRIRELIEKYDGQAAATELGTYPRHENREWVQYALPDRNIERTDRCPLHLRDGASPGGSSNASSADSKPSIKPYQLTTISDRTTLPTPQEGDEEDVRVE